MRSVTSLLEECIEVCGGQAKLARRIGCKPQDIHVMHSGARPISPMTVGLLCDVLELDGEEARRLAVLAVIGAAKPEKRGVLRRAFFVSWALGVACGVALITALWPSSYAQAKKIDDPVMIVALNRVTETVASLYIVAHRLMSWTRGMSRTLSRARTRLLQGLTGCAPA